MPPGRVIPAYLIVFALPFATAQADSTLPTGLAQGLSQSLAADRLSASSGAGDSHVLVAIDQPNILLGAGTPIAPLAPSRGLNAPTDSSNVIDVGLASWYGSRWRGRRTASGARFDPEAMTAASPTLPIGTRVLVTLEGTAHSVVVTITDRQGPVERVIDLSRAAARKIGILARGTARVVLRRL